MLPIASSSGPAFIGVVVVGAALLLWWLLRGESRDEAAAKADQEAGGEAAKGAQRDPAQNAEQLAARGADLTRVLDSARRALNAANLLFVSANDLVAPRSRERDNLYAALRDLADAVSSLRSFAQKVDRNPSVLLRGRAEP